MGSLLDVFTGKDAQDPLKYGQIAGKVAACEIERMASVRELYEEYFGVKLPFVDSELDSSDLNFDWEE